MAGELEVPAGQRRAVPAYPVPAAEAPGYSGRTAKSAGADSGSAGSGEAGNAEKPGRSAKTGWEGEREFLLRIVQAALRRGHQNRSRIQRTAEEKSALHGNHRGLIGGAVGAGVRAVSALGQLTDDDSDDADEQKRQYEAAQAASNTGAIIGLTIGALEAITQNNHSLTRTQDEEHRIQEEEDFNEFLTRLDEEYGYEEEQGQSM